MQQCGSVKVRDVIIIEVIEKIQWKSFVIRFEPKSWSVFNFEKNVTPCFHPLMLYASV